MLETHPFDNFIPENMRCLILGSFTSYGSKKGVIYDWFYSNGRNQFWPIISGIYGVQLSTKEEKQKLFTSKGIGVTDIIYQCERKMLNSLDTSLVNIVINPKLENILKDTKPPRILFTSRFVEKLFTKSFKQLVIELPQIELIVLPSPSPRYARMTKAEKISKYSQLLPK